MIAHSPLEADIILVNSTTAEGVSFATDWPDKIVLDEVWAREALDGGMYAPPEQNWGGHRVYPTEPPHASDLNKYVPSVKLPIFVIQLISKKPFTDSSPDTC